MASKRRFYSMRGAASGLVTYFQNFDRAMFAAGIPNPEVIHDAFLAVDDTNDLLKETAQFLAQAIVRKEEFETRGYYACFSKVKMTYAETLDWLKSQGLQYLSPSKYENKPLFLNNWLELTITDQHELSLGSGSKPFLCRDWREVRGSLGRIWREVDFYCYIESSRPMLIHDAETILAQRNYRLLTCEEAEKLGPQFPSPDDVTSPQIVTANNAPHSCYVIFHDDRFNVKQHLDPMWHQGKGNLADPSVGPGFFFLVKNWASEKPSPTEMDQILDWMNLRDLPCPAKSEANCGVCSECDGCEFRYLDYLTGLHNYPKP